jgi:hypothetical protein
MNVGLCILWWLDLDDKINILNVKSTRCNICSYKNLELSLFESLHGDLSLVLSNITMHDFDVLADFIR